MTDEQELEDLHVEAFGFCGCGRPEDNAQYVLGFLKILIDENMIWAPPKNTTQDNVNFIGAEALLKWYDEREFGDNDGTFEEFQAKKIEYCGNEESMLFLLYWLDMKGYTEHGGSVYSSFISREGVELYGKYIGEYEYKS